MNTAAPPIRKACPACGQDLVIRRNRQNDSEFLGCSQWPKCTHTEPVPAYVEAMRMGNPPLPGMEP